MPKNTKKDTCCGFRPVRGKAAIRPAALPVFYSYLTRPAPFTVPPMIEDS